MRIFITGLTGSLGTALAKLHRERGDVVVGCARSEAGAVRWLRDHPGCGHLMIRDAFEADDPRGDVRRRLADSDRCYHLAAMKHVELCEDDPREAFRQNVGLTEAVSRVCRDAEVDLILASTDKAFRPEGVYGAAKLLAERIALKHGGSVVRLVNLIGSSGSVLSTWTRARRRGERIKLTDPDMTRFFMTLREAAVFMADHAVPGKVNVPVRARAIRMGDLAKAFAGAEMVDVVGPRPGETRHQLLSDGLSSETAGRWDVDELLAEATSEEILACVPSLSR